MNEKIRTCTLIFSSRFSRASASYLPPRKSAVTQVATIRRIRMPQRTRSIESRSPPTSFSQSRLNFSEELILAITVGLMQRFCQKENRSRYGHDVRVRYRRTIGYTHHMFSVSVHLRKAICEAFICEDFASQMASIYIFMGTFQREPDGRSGTRAEDPYRSHSHDFTEPSQYVFHRGQEDSLVLGLASDMPSDGRQCCGSFTRVSSWKSQDNHVKHSRFSPTND